MGLILLRGTKNKTDREESCEGFSSPCKRGGICPEYTGLFPACDTVPSPWLPSAVSFTCHEANALPSMGSVEPEAFHERSLGHLAASQLCVCFL